MMTSKAILDTDILSEYLKGRNTTVTNRAAAYARDHGVFTFTSITVYEIVYGLELKGASSQLKKIMTWLKQNEEITPINLDYLAAAHIKATARRQGLIGRTSGLLNRFDCSADELASCDWQYR